MTTLAFVRDRTFRGLLVSFLVLIPLKTQADQDPIENLSGQWCATTFYDNGGDTTATEQAELQILMIGTDVAVTTSHGSYWQGTYDQARRALRASYTRNQHKGRVILWLDETGAQLEGEWFNHKGGSGQYIAVRKQGSSCSDGPTT